MSADNGVYILETVRFTEEGYTEEYRVKHLQAIDNIDWDEAAGEYTDDEDIRIDNAREMFGDVIHVFTDRNEAADYAYQMYNDIGYAEYGVCFVSINREF